MAAHTRRAESTVSRLASGSGDTLRRLEAVREDGKPKHRITTDRVHEIFAWFDLNWPADLAWPRDVPRPRAQKRGIAA